MTDTREVASGWYVQLNDPTTDSFPAAEGITTSTAADWKGRKALFVYGYTRESVVEYVRANWPDRLGETEERVTFTEVLPPAMWEGA